jgi:hypothetical protein
MLIICPFFDSHSNKAQTLRICKQGRSVSYKIKKKRVPLQKNRKDTKIWKKIKGENK